MDKKELEYLKNKYVGKNITIVSMEGEPNYSGKAGIVKYVDDIGQLHGSWGGLAVQPEHDDFRII